ncbi:hypothetical protein [Streptomyces cadmiisoli]|uniref:hypothetical protein n=1 Tax=Streptomyces cadmiisoli TaxID=2184053 RepID=UPI003D704DF8
MQMPIACGHPRTRGEGQILDTLIAAFSELERILVQHRNSAVRPGREKRPERMVLEAQGSLRNTAAPAAQLLLPRECAAIGIRSGIPMDTCTAAVR